MEQAPSQSIRTVDSRRDYINTTTSTSIVRHITRHSPTRARHTTIVHHLARHSRRSNASAIRNDRPPRAGYQSPNVRHTYTLVANGATDARQLHTALSRGTRGRPHLPHGAGFAGLTARHGVRLAHCTARRRRGWWNANVFSKQRGDADHRRGAGDYSSDSLLIRKLTPMLDQPSLVSGGILISLIAFYNKRAAHKEEAGEATCLAAE